MAPDAGYLSLLLPLLRRSWYARHASVYYIYANKYARLHKHVHASESAVCVCTPHGGNIRVSIYVYIHTISSPGRTPRRRIHSIMLSGETRLSRILKGFNNIWKLLPKSWRSSSSLRYVLGATLGIRPIHLPSPLRGRIPKVSGARGY